MYCSTIDEVLGKAIFRPASLSQLLSPTRSEQFVRVYEYGDQTDRAIVMQVVDQLQPQLHLPHPSERSSPPSPPPASLTRLSKRQKRPVSVSRAHAPAQYHSFPTTYASFQCACLHARCSCVYSRLHGVMLSALGEHSCYELRAVHWLHWIRQQRQLGSELTGAKLCAVWSEWHHDAFRDESMQHAE